MSNSFDRGIPARKALFPTCLKTDLKFGQFYFPNYKFTYRKNSRFAVYYSYHIREENKL